jgi:hypothetical protein
MALPEEIGFLDDSVTLPEVLKRALRTRSLASLRTAHVLDELARQVGFKVDHLGDSSYEVLWDLLRVLEANVEEEGPGSWLDDVDSERHWRIAEKAVARQSVDMMLDAARDFGWRRAKVKSSGFSDVASTVRTAFARELAEWVRQLLETWRNSNVWNRSMESRQ